MPYPTKKLGEVLEYEQPTNYLVSSTDYKDEYPIPVLTAGKSFILGNTNERSGIFPKEKLPVIIFDDFTTAIKFVDYPFKVKSSAMKILHAKKDKADIRFLFYKMLTIKFQHEQHKRYWISECANLKIPLPPLEIQKQIVERLDKIVEAQKLNDGLIQKFPIIDQSDKFIVGYTDNEEKVYKIDYPVIIFGDHTRIFKYVDFNFAIGADGTQIIIPNAEKFIPKFFYFSMLNLKVNNLGYSRHFKLLKTKKLIIPPLQTQKQIVAKLSAVQEYKKRLVEQKVKLKELFDSALHKSMSNK